MVTFLSKIARPLWEGKTSIYSFIKEQGETVGGSLPDDEEFWSGSKLRWVAGGLDGAFGHHARPGQMTDETDELVHLLAKQSRNSKNSIRKALYTKLVKTDISSQIDSILEALRKQPGIKPDALFKEAKWFAENGAHRNVEIRNCAAGPFPERASEGTVADTGDAR
ncbi:hypothetical protein [Paenibacillus sp. GCM10012304]|uniref:Uncharacterized protein n=2 Tax=Paenibacillus violae TaxID=3077234 RepID=A0ABU3RNL7_9BACL|nr:hypothetical protein [Paenibacillus sp. PFR10]